MAAVLPGPGTRLGDCRRSARGVAAPALAVPPPRGPATTEGWRWAARLLLRLAEALARRAEARRRQPGDLGRLSPHLRRDVGLDR